jgi:hypothetical protein
VRTAALPVVAVAVVVVDAPPLLIVAVCVPAVAPSVQRDEVRPAAFVVAAAGANDPPCEAANVTGASLTEFPKRSVA